MTPDELQKIRKKMKLTQTEFGAGIGVARNTVTRWEIGLVVIPEPMAKLIRLTAAQQRKKRK